MFGYIIQLFYLRIVNVPKRFLQYKKKKKDVFIRSLMKKEKKVSRPLRIA